MENYANQIARGPHYHKIKLKKQMSHYFTASTVSELICLIFAIICLAKDVSLVWRSMILYQLITCIIEFSGIFVERAGHYNYWVYNILLVFDAGFMSLMFAYIFKQYHQSKLIVITGLALFIMLYAAEFIFQGFSLSEKYNNLTYTVMCVVYVLYSLYFYYLLLKDEHYIHLKYSPIFWWVAGTLLFYFGNTACNLFSNQLRAIKIYQHLSYYIYKALNIILYGFWSYSFICRRWRTKKSEIL
jgi:hypothetical protein